MTTTTLPHPEPAPPVARTAPPVRTAGRDMVAMAASVFQFGLAIGATIATSNVDPVGGLAAGAFLGAGASQLAAIGLIHGGAGIVVAAATALLINLRFVLYSDGLARWFADEPRWRRFALAFPLSDPVYVVCHRRFGEHTDRDWRRRYYLAAATGLVGSFTAGQLVGYVVGDAVPPAVGLELATPLVFAGLLGMMAQSRRALLGAATAAAVVPITAPHLGGLAITVAVVAALTVGTLADTDEP